MKRVLVCVAVCAVAACSNDVGGGVVEDPDGTCDSRATSVPICNDYDVDDDDVSFFEMICMGTWSTTQPCDRATACGMCAQPMDGFNATTYYYAGSGAESANAEHCASIGGTWIDEPSVTCD